MMQLLGSFLNDPLEEDRKEHKFFRKKICLLGNKNAYTIYKEFFERRELKYF
jgi:hypothetical protein